MARTRTILRTRTIFRALVAGALLCASAAVAAARIEPGHADVLGDTAETLPPDDAAWRRVALPDSTHDGTGRAAWLRIAFERPAGGDSWALYIPYLYGGGRIYLNREPLASVPQTDASHRVRWEQPHLIALPDSKLRPGPNVLHLRVAAAHPPNGLLFARPAIGPQEELHDLYDRRQRWVRTLPQVTVAVCLLFAALVGYIWWQRRGEVLYGLFALAVALWGVRTMTFVIESLPLAWWDAWRVVYHSANGGFVVTMALFAMRFAGLQRRWVARGLFGYWLIGPVALLASSGRAETLVSRLWSLGLIPVGISVVVLVGIAWHRHRNAAAAALLAATALAVASGIHDYLVAWQPGMLGWLLPDWAGHRIFLMHVGANLMLLVMAGLLAARFVGSLSEVEQLNATLEKRVAAREAELATNYRRMAVLEGEKAAADERHRIMRELHDGLGSQLFTSLSRVERGGIDSAGIAQVLRQCIAEMRLALEALGSEEQDFGAALGNFLFRWEGQLREAGVHPTWEIDAPDAALKLSPHTALQLLRVLQEALTNVLKHAQAKQVRVSLRDTGAALRLSVEDDGRGIAGPDGRGGRGLANMRARAQELGALLDVQSQPGRTRVMLELPRT